MAWTTRQKAEHYSREWWALIQRLGGQCAFCGSWADLEVDHINGRTYETRKLNRWQRVRIYKREEKEGLIRVLCSSCNASRPKFPLKRRTTR